MQVIHYEAAIFYYLVNSIQLQRTQNCDIAYGLNKEYFFSHIFKSHMKQT